MGAELSKQVEEELEKSQAQQQLQRQVDESSSSKQVLKEAPSLPQNNLKTAVNNNKSEKKQVEKHSGTQTLNLKPSSPGHGQKKPVKQPSLSQSLQHILKGADSPIDKSSEHKLYDQLYSGIFLHHKTQKYWMNKKSNCNCFILYARALSITWADTEKYWKWVPLEESSGTVIEVAELKRVCWLEVHGRFDTRKLSPGILYEVSFHVMLKDAAQGWEVPINVRLVLPGGKKQEHEENLNNKQRGRWMEIPVGHFVASAHEDEGEMEFSMYEYDAGIWKLGLLVKGVSIKPNSDDYKLAL